MIKTKTHKIVVASLLLAIGILLPFVTSHGLGFLPGNVFLPMHIPVLLCGFFCGPVYGAMLGFLLPFFNSFLTSMPALYPNAIIMSGELLTYGFMTGLIHKCTGYSQKLRHIYPALIISMIAGRVVYGIIFEILLLTNPGLKVASVIVALTSGIPGIIIQLVLIPVIVTNIYKSISQKYVAKDEAVKMIEDGRKTCVVVKDNKIISAESPKGIYHIINLYEAGDINGAYVADTVIGKAAAMIFSLAGVKGCYGQTMSKKALEWLNNHNIEATYNTLTDVIINRKGDGMCPMEATVIDVDDEKTALALLKDKVAELQNKASISQEEAK